MKQGDIFLVDFGSNSVGHEYQKRRPALVVESDTQLTRTSLITVMPLTSAIHNKMLEDVLVKKDERNLLMEDSVLKVYSLVSFDLSRFVHKIGEVNDAVIAQMKMYVRKHFDI